jgi:hypothetical protein
MRSGLCRDGNLRLALGRGNGAGVMQASKKRQFDRTCWRELEAASGSARTMPCCVVRAADFPAIGGCLIAAGNHGVQISVTRRSLREEPAPTLLGCSLGVWGNRRPTQPPRAPQANNASTIRGEVFNGQVAVPGIAPLPHKVEAALTRKSNMRPGRCRPGRLHVSAGWERLLLRDGVKRSSIRRARRSASLTLALDWRGLASLAAHRPEKPLRHCRWTKT